MMYYQIIRADESSKNYKIFSEMLDDFDRQDAVDLYSLVKEMYEIISPEGYDILLWGDLITLFESSEEDTEVAIHMMVEKKYPLTQEMLSKMLNRRLEIDHERDGMDLLLMGQVRKKDGTTELPGIELFIRRCMISTSGLLPRLCLVYVNATKSIANTDG
ncbi:hypothetical protein Tco_0296659 [Tanacetum coccineum]